MLAIRIYAVTGRNTRIAAVLLVLNFVSSGANIVRLLRAIFYVSRGWLNAQSNPVRRRGKRAIVGKRH